jgi:hypothetical protein
LPPEPPTGGPSLNSGHASFFAWIIYRRMLAEKSYSVIMFSFVSTITGMILMVVLAMLPKSK